MSRDKRVTSSDDRTGKRETEIVVLGTLCIHFLYFDIRKMTSDTASYRMYFSIDEEINNNKQLRYDSTFTNLHDSDERSVLMIIVENARKGAVTVSRQWDKSVLGSTP